MARMLICNDTVMKIRLGVSFESVVSANMEWICGVYCANFINSYQRLVKNKTFHIEKVI